MKGFESEWFLEVVLVARWACSRKGSPLLANRPSVAPPNGCHSNTSERQLVQVSRVGRPAILTRTADGVSSTRAPSEVRLKDLKGWCHPQDGRKRVPTSLSDEWRQVRTLVPLGRAARSEPGRA